MEIIKNKKKTICKNCHTELIFTPDDIKTKFILNSPYITCPVCNNDIYIEYANIKEVEK